MAFKQVNPLRGSADFARGFRHGQEDGKTGLRSRIDQSQSIDFRAGYRAGWRSQQAKVK